MENLSSIRALTWELNLLYVEDETDIQASMGDVLRVFFRNVVIAGDGEAGLEEFQKGKFDLVISDIHMPKMDGLAMIEKIRELKSDIPIIVTTAFGDQDYFLRSIDLKIDKYLLKPIEKEKATEAFYAVGKLIDDRNKAHELEITKMQDKINRLSEKIVAQITDSYLAPCLIFTDSKIRYFNNAFSLLLEPEVMKTFLSSDGKLDVFDQRKDFLHALSEYDPDEPTKNKVSISKKIGRKIYRLNRQNIMLDDTDSESQIYFFIDITIEEYQKIKISSYTKVLEELVINNRYRKPVTKEVKQEVKPKIEPQVSPPSEMIDFSESDHVQIDSAENALLRRSHVHKTTATDYIAELDDEVLTELQELDELDHDFGDAIYRLKEEKDLSILQELASKFETYAHEISLLFEFEDLAYAIRALAHLLQNVDTAQIDDAKLKKLVIFLSGIQSDLANWRHVLFVEQSALDIHYLDSSLFSACLQIELILTKVDKDQESEEEDLVLF